MENNLIESIANVCKILNKNSVEYLIVGGTAVALHGFFRYSRSTSGEVAEKHDLDFWYNSTYDNYYKLLNALEELGRDVSKFRAEVAPNVKKSFFKYEFDQFTIDFLPAIPGLARFRSSYNEKAVSKVGEIEIPIIKYEDLIISKQTQARPKDIEDIEQLKLRRTPPR